MSLLVLLLLLVRGALAASPCSFIPFSPDLHPVDEASLERGHHEIQALAANGVTTVLPGKSPGDPKQIEKLEFLYGTKIVFADDVPEGQGPVLLPGVVFHPGDAPPLGKAYRGEINPDLLDYAASEDMNKLTEMKIAAKVDPTSVARTLSATELMLRPRLVAEESRRRSLSERILAGTPVADLSAALAASLDMFLDEVKAEFPRLAYIKDVEEFQTGDREEQMTTRNLVAAKAVGEFLAVLDAAREKLGAGANGDRLKSELYETIESRGARLLYLYLFQPEGLLAQEGLRIKKTPLGYPMEFRVSFAQGHAIDSGPRYSWELMPEDAQAALEYFEQLYARFPRRYRLLEGGADVMKTEDGWKIIEFNFGEANGARLAEEHLVSANLYVSELTGKPTPLVRELESIYATGSLDAQRAFLRSLPGYYAEIGVDPDRVQGAVEETQIWFRDRIVHDLFLVDPTIPNARLARDRISALLSEGSVLSDPESVLQGGLDYLDRRLAELSALPG